MAVPKAHTFILQTSLSTYCMPGPVVKARNGLDLSLQFYKSVGASHSPILRIRNVKLKDLKPPWQLEWGRDWGSHSSSTVYYLGDWTSDSTNSQALVFHL